MKPAPFEYVRPASLDEAVAFLAEYPYEAKAISGGQSLVPVLNLRLARVQYLVDIGRLPELAGITVTADGGLRLGALVRHRELEQSPVVREHCPLLTEGAALIGHPAIRNWGTLGGSLAHADPAAELPAAMLALDATIVVRGSAGERRIPGQDFFLGLFTTALEPGELLVAVEIPAVDPAAGWSFVELARRHGDFAMAGVAAGISVQDGVCGMARIALMGVGDAPLRATAAEQILLGRQVTLALLGEAARAVAPELDPPGDLHATGEYRRELAVVLTERALLRAWERAGGAGTVRETQVR